LQGAAWVAVVEFEEVRQGLTVLEGNQGQVNLAETTATRVGAGSQTSWFLTAFYCLVLTAR